ncbi:ABC transporter permease [Jiangella aurantiaca]|uniref:ABC transporter permease n=1 Tax=Jiangella aurantiaca TaxID=2530373 RepID=A0A4R5A9B5_9ACTN|nr:ABC transporter permease [Jiangella aurantiaca]TDD68898.1 ABC transporter permease [Jiangella aurantiaca]
MTGLLAVKLRRDLRATWPRIALMVVAIAVSLTAFSAVLYAWSAIDREVERAYLSTEPASATIRFAPGVDTERMAAIAAEARDQPGVLEATGRTQFTSDITVVGEPRDVRLQVFAAAPDDPLTMARFFVEDGAWPPDPGEIYLGRDSLDLLEVAVGDAVTVETPDGEAIRLWVAGTVYDPSLSPAAQEQAGRGYLSTASLAAVGESEAAAAGQWSPGSPLDQLKIQVAGPDETTPSRDRDTIVAVAGDVALWLQQAHGLAVAEIQVPEPYAHPHQGQADALLSALLVGAGAALLLSTILVANMLGGLFAQQIPQIGIMKAIGARAGSIARLYLAMTLLIAGVATLLALAPGILIGRAFAPAVFDFLGIDPAGLAPAWWTYLVVLAAGVVLPVLMALVPLVKTSRTTVRAAIDHRGAGADPRRATRVLARLGRIARLDRGLLMALRNTIRRPARFLLSAGLLASAGMMFVAGLSARDGMEAVAAETAELLQWDVAVQLATPVSVDVLAPVVGQVSGVERFEGWTTASASLSGPGGLPVSRTYPDQGHGRLQVTALPADTTTFAPPELSEGRWLEAQETGAIVLNQVTLAAADADIQTGDTVQLSIAGVSTRWRVVGIAEERGATSSAYVTAEGLATALGEPRWSNALRIVTSDHDEQARATAADAVDQALAGAGIDVQSADSVGRQEAVTGGHLEPILVILLATALPMGVIGCIGLASTMGANVLERIREFGVMHAIGARPKAVRRIVIAEGIFIALASCLLAVLPALGVTAAIGALLGNTFMYAPLPFRPSILAALIWTGLVVLGAWLATDAAATRASRLTVREALAYL